MIWAVQIPSYTEQKSFIIIQINHQIFFEMIAMDLSVFLHIFPGMRSPRGDSIALIEAHGSICSF